MMMPAEAAFKHGLADFAAGHKPNDHFSRDSLLQAAYRAGYEAAKRETDRHLPADFPMDVYEPGKPLRPILH